MKITVTKRIVLTGISGILVLAGGIGLTALPGYAAPVAPAPCPTPVIGEDGEPVTVECPTEPYVDTIAPYVKITNPSDTDLKRNKQVLVTALALDNASVVKVELYLDGSLLATASGSTGAATWTPTAKGSYTLSAKAYDPSGNIGTTQLLVTVK